MFLWKTYGYVVVKRRRANYNLFFLIYLMTVKAMRIALKKVNFRQALRLPNVI